MTNSETTSAKNLRSCMVCGTTWEGRPVANITCGQAPCKIEAQARYDAAVAERKAAKAARPAPAPKELHQDLAGWGAIVGLNRMLAR